MASLPISAVMNYYVMRKTDVHETKNQETPKTDLVLQVTGVLTLLFTFANFRNDVTLTTNSHCSNTRRYYLTRR